MAIIRDSLLRRIEATICWLDNPSKGAFCLPGTDNLECLKNTPKAHQIFLSTDPFGNKYKALEDIARDYEALGRRVTGDTVVVFLLLSVQGCDQAGEKILELNKWIVRRYQLEWFRSFDPRTLSEMAVAASGEVQKRCHFPSSSLMPSESYEDYINRCSSSIKQITDTCSSEGTILIIGHCSSLDSLPRPLLGLPTRKSSEFAKFVKRVPSLAMCFCREMKEEKRWQMVNPPVEMLTHGANIAFNWKHIILDN